MRIEIHHYIHNGDETESLKLLRQILNLNKITVAKVSDIEAKVDALQTALDNEQTQIQAAIDALNTTVQELRDQIAAGDAEALERIATKLDTITSDLSSTIADTPEEPQP